MCGRVLERMKFMRVYGELKKHVKATLAWKQKRDMASQVVSFLAGVTVCVVPIIPIKLVTVSHFTKDCRVCLVSLVSKFYRLF
jgi:hypothetical protein